MALAPRDGKEWIEAHRSNYLPGIEAHDFKGIAVGLRKTGIVAPPLLLSRTKGGRKILTVTEI
jgi:hypothetical protein